MKIACTDQVLFGHVLVLMPVELFDLSEILTCLKFLDK